LAKSRKDTVIFERRFIPKGSIIIQEGDEGNSAYLVQSGSVRVFTEQNGKKIILSDLEIGSIFGEMSLLFDSPRTASVEASQDCNLIVISRKNLHEKLERSDVTIKAIVYMLIDRIIGNNKKFTENKESTIEELEDSTKLIYSNVLEALPAGDRPDFQASVLPALEKFIECLDEFK